MAWGDKICIKKVEWEGGQHFIQGELLIYIILITALLLEINYITFMKV
jgi:hypothetical protein